jgi:hypothetical protein
MLDLQPLAFDSAGFAVARPGRVAGGPFVTTGTALVYDLDFQFGADATSLSNSGFSFARSGVAYDEWGNSYSTNTPRIIPGKGLLIEAARTNSIRNNSMIGAVAGTAGTLPTNWSIGGATGLTRQIVGTGTLGGFTYLDIRFFGTTGDSSGIAIYPEAFTAIAAVSAQVWTASAYLALVGGTLANLTSASLEVAERDSGGTFLTSTTTTGALAALTPTLTRFSVSRTLNNGSTAHVATGVRVLAGTGVAVDYTLRIAAPQVESGAFVSTPILTTTTAVTRNAETCTATRTASALINGTVLIDATMAPGAPPTGNHYLWVVSDGTTNNRVLAAANTTPEPFGTVTAGGVSQAAPTAGAATVGAGLRLGLRWTTDNVAVVLNGGTPVTDTLATIPATLTTERIGGDGVSGTQQWMGFIKRIRRYSSVWSDSDLQLATAGFDLNLASGEATASDLAAAGFSTTRATTGWDELGRSYTSGVARIVPGRGMLVSGARTNIAFRSQEFDNASWSKVNSTVTANQILAPDGTLTADHLTRGSTANGYLQQGSLSFTSGTVYTGSVYAKIGTLGGKLGLRLVTSYPARVDAVFDLATGAVLFSGATTWTGVSASSVAIGGGWYRCILTGTADQTIGTAQILVGGTDLSTASWEGTTTVVPNCYVWQAQVESASFVGTPIVTTSAAVTRNAETVIATRPATGTVQGSFVASALMPPGVVSGEHNYLWDLNDGTSANRVIAYRNASTTVPTFQVDASSVTQAALTGATVANSVVARAAGRWATNNVAASFVGATVSTDTLATIPSTMTSERLGDSTIASRQLWGYLRRVKRTPTLMTDAELQAASNGYDLSFSLGATAAELSGSGWSYSRAGAAYDLWGNIYQANQPRIARGHGILLEGARTNQVLQSNTFSSGSWTKTEMTLTAAAGVSPDGTANAWSMVESANSASRTMQSSVSFTSGTTYCFSCYYKPLPGSATRYARILLPAVAFGASSLGANFDTNTGAATNVGAGVTTSAVSIGAGWWRFSVTATATTTVSGNVIIGMSVNTLGTTNYAGDGASGLLLWQAQCEAGSFPSSPITTTSSTVARPADVLTASRAAGLLTTGSVLIEGTTPRGLDASVNAALYSLYINAATYLWAYRGTSRAIGVDSQAGGQAFATVADRTHLRLAMTWTSTGYRACLNGGTVQAGTGSGAFTSEALGDLPPYTRPFFGYVRRIARTGEAWSDAQLKGFTTGAVL